MNQPEPDRIQMAADDFLVLIGEGAEDYIEDAAAGTWPGGYGNYGDAIGSPAALAHNERTFALVARRLSTLLLSAADAADARAAAVSDG